MQNNNTSTTLYHRNKHDTCWIWRVWTEGADVVTEYGTVLGKRQQSRFTCETKNPGKANETTPEDQAVLEMESLIRYKLDKKYKKTLEETEEFTFGAMLASSKQFADYKDKLEFPIYINVKLNGNRCLVFWNETEDDIIFLSRGKKEFTTVNHLKKEIMSILPKSAFFDGELYIHGTSLQAINSLVKKYRPNETEKIQYHIYDYCEFDSKEDDFTTRYEKLHKIFGSAIYNHLSFVNASPVNSMPELLLYDQENVDAGYEGSILRKPSGKYQFNQRSNDLLKVKRFVDSEYEVVGYTNGKGKNLNSVIWVCDNGAGKTFSVEMNDNYAVREEYLKNAESYIGKMLTVKYFELSDDRVPIFQKGLQFRLEEDLP